MTEAEKERVDSYLNTINRLEPDIAMIDAGAAYASIAISLKRIADSIERLPNDISDAIAQGFFDATRRK